MTYILFASSFEREQKTLDFLSNIYTEPIGLKAPAFSNDAYSQSFIRGEHQSFGLLCNVQAFPIPIIRQVRSPNFAYTSAKCGTKL